MITRIIVVIFSLSALISPSAMAALNLRPQTAQINLRIVRGDTFQNLFGDDWYAAWRENQIVIIREGRALTSPDILLEGSIVTVSGAVRLTPRAQTRVAELAKLRAALEARLARVEAQLNRVPAAAALLSTCRKGVSGIDEQPQHAGELAWQLEELEALALAQGKTQQPSPPPTGEPVRGSVVPWAMGCLVLAIGVWALWTLRTRRKRDAVMRYREAIAAIDVAWPQ